VGRAPPVPDPFGVPWARRQASNLKLAAYQVFEDARATQGPDLSQAADRTIVDEEVGRRLPVVAPVGELLAQAQRRVAGRLDDLEVVARAG
jgi:hypothetical protein